MARQIVGIDLGTSNTTLARIPADGIGCHTVKIVQRISATEVAERELLPSFLYLPGAHELPEGATALPWDQDRPYLVGEFARFQGSKIPGRVIGSAKSWLTHRRSDPTEPILPWDRAKDLEPVSPVEASSRYLRHLVESWNHQFEDDSLQNQEVILTVPASFDDLARKLTAGAAADNGLTVRLLEEPQAAFYAWLYKNRKSWRKRVEPGEHILVCDIGGGTTDFTLIEVGDKDLKRVAVGDHLMLGGDNLDIALARRVEPRLEAKLDMLQWGVLQHQCRRAKEVLLDEDGPEDHTVTVPGSGAKLLSSALTASVEKQEVTELVLDGFFPLLDFEDDDGPKTQRGLKEWGLPYESDPAVPRHLSRFLRRQQRPVPDKVLFNGGACRPPAIRQRVLEILSRWKGSPVTELENPNSHLAVARGAAYYGWLRRTGGARIGGGSARSYYVGLSGAEGKKALCVAPRNLEEGKALHLQEPELKLVVGQPVRFPLYSSSDRPSDQEGELVEVGLLSELPPLETVVQSKGRKGEIPVRLSCELTEVGTLEIGCENPKLGHWSLEFTLRGAHAGGASTELVSKPVQQARATIEEAFEQKPSKLGKGRVRPRTLLTVLEEDLGRPREDWSSNVLRAFWDSLYGVARRRRVEPEYEAAWFNGIGYCLRPGLGLPLDAWRMEQMQKIFDGWMQFPKDESVKLQFWIMWRRIAPGVPRNLQEQLWAQVHPFLLPGRKHIKTRNKGQRTPDELKEMTRCAASLERVERSEKEALGKQLVEGFQDGVEDYWLLARLAARDPVGGGSGPNTRARGGGALGGGSTGEGTQTVSPSSGPGHGQDRPGDR